MWGAIKLGDAVPRPEPGAGAGIKTGAAPAGSGIFVVDLDGQAAVDWWLAQCAEKGGHGATYTVLTPRGAHLYFAHPGFPVPNSVGHLAPGVDVRGEGGFVVAAGSPHKSGGTYALAVDEEPAPAPAWLIDWLRERSADAVVVAEHVNDIPPGEERDRRRELFSKACAEYPPSIEGQGGDAALWRIVQHGALDLALPDADIIEIVGEVFDPRCVPPWGEELASRVAHKARNAKTKSTRPAIEPVPAELEDLFAGRRRELPTFERPAWVLEQTEGAACAAIGDAFEGCVDASPPPSFPPSAAPAPDAGPIRWGRWDEPVPPVDWLVEGLIPKATVGALVAHGSSLKTWTELSLGSAVAQGKPWLGRYATKRGRVLVLDYESGLYEMRRRMGILERAPVTDLGVWPTPERFVDDAGFWAELVKIPDVVLLCVDSLAAGTSPNVDENGREAAIPLQLAARYSDATGASVMFVHHSKKDDGGDARKSVRGSTAIYAALDWCFAFESVEETPEAKRMRMTSIKSSMGPRPMPVDLELTDSGLAACEGGAKPLRSDASDSDVQARILLALRQHGALPTVDKIARDIGVRRQRVTEEIKAMLVTGEVAKVPNVGFVPNTPSDLEQRVVALLNDPARVWSRESDVATAAGVDTEAVRDLVRRGVVVRSGEGRLLAVRRP